MPVLKAEARRIESRPERAEIFSLKQGIAAKMQDFP